MPAISKLSFILAPSLLLLSGCASVSVAERQAELAQTARAAAGDLTTTLSGELRAAMSAGGPANAIGVCKERAPAITRELASRTGLHINRVSTKNRNPAGVPDAWERAAIAQFEQRLARGERPEDLEFHEVVGEGRAQTFRYARALVTQPVCLACHGAPEHLGDAVKARLAADYPHDKAVGYAAGTVRGIVSMRKPL